MRQFPSGTVLAVTGSFFGGWTWDHQLADTLDLYGWKVTLFIDPDTLGGTDRLAAEDLPKMVARGHEIGLTLDESLSVDRPLSELKAKLAAAAGTEIVSFAYPCHVGDISQLVQEVGSAGFRLGLTQNTGVVRLSTPDMLRLPSTGSVLCDFGDLQAWIESAEEAGDGVLHLVGTTADYTDDSHRWADMECNLSWPCGRLDTWYRPLRGVFLD